jgi:TonB-linked SusC/RagA family outer membrane protein
MKKIKTTILVGLFLTFSTLSYSQSTIAGAISDTDGNPIPGVTIIIEGTTNGTTSDFDGNYSISVSSGQSLEFSSLGFASQVVEVSSQSTLNIILEASAESLDEIIVTGYSSQRKRDITGAVAVIEVDEMNKTQATSFLQKLEGRATGIQVSTSGEPGEGSTIRIRGVGSLNNNEPLYIIDGIPVQDSFGTSINPSDIENIQVLKDAASAAVYGARANNGVIIITTKKGLVDGDIKVTYDSYVGYGQAGRNMDYMIKDPYDYQTFIKERYANGGLEVSPLNPYSYPQGTLPTYLSPYGVSGIGDVSDETLYSYPDYLIMKSNKEGTDWFGEVFQGGITHEHNVGISGGSEKGRFYMSAGYLDQEGAMVFNKFTRMSLRANSDFTIGKVKIGENLQVSRSTRMGGNDSTSGGNQDEQGVMHGLQASNVIIPVYDIGGNFGGARANGIQGNNEYARLYRNKDNPFNGYRILGNAFAELEIIDGLVAKTSFGIDANNGWNSAFSYGVPEAAQPNFNNGFRESWNRTYNWTWTNTVKYNKTIDSHVFQVLAGYESVKNTFRSINGSFAQYVTEDPNAWYLNGALADPNTRGISSNGNFSTLASFFGKVDYSFDDKYIASFTIRRDGSSNFGTGFKYGTFPAGSLGWRVSEEAFMASTTWIDDMKIRAGYGITGNQAIPAGNAFSRFGGGTGSTFYDINGTQNSIVTGYALVNRGNPDGRWEEQTSTNIGLDATLFNNKLDIVFDYWTRATDGLLYDVQNPGASGVAVPAFVNIASMENQGIDLAINWTSATSGDFQWNVGVNFSQFTNTLTSIDGNASSFIPGGFDSRIGIVNRAEVGEPVGAFYGYQTDGYFNSQAEADASNQSGAAPGRIKFVDRNNDGLINDDDQGFIGSAVPDFTAGINIGFNYQNWDFSAFFFASAGNEVFNYQKLFDVFAFFNTNVRQTRLTDSWIPSNPNPDALFPINDINDIFSNRPSDFYVEDASYLRARTIQLGYSFNNIKGMSSLRLYVQGDNLFTITNYSGLDPAPSSFGINNGSTGNADLWNGYDLGNYPVERKLLFGVNARF